MTTMVLLLYAVAGVASYVWPCRTELPPRSAVFFSVLWPVMYAAIVLHQLNKWVEHAFSWIVDRLDQ